MATTPETVTTTIVKDFNWIKGHVILLLVVAALIFFGVYEIENLIANHDKQKDAQWQQVLAAQTQQTQLLAGKLAQDENAWSAQNAQNQQLILTLAQTISKRDAAVQKQQQIDTTLSAKDAAERLAQQTKAGAGEVVAQGDSVTVDLPVTRQVVQLLDRLPVAEADLADTQKQLGAETVVATNLQANVNEQKSLVESLKTQNTDQIKACQAQVKDLKAQARKSKLKYFGAGVVVGFLLHFAAGV